MTDGVKHQGTILKKWWFVAVLLFVGWPGQAYAKKIAVLFRGDIPPYLAILESLEKRSGDRVLGLDVIKNGAQSPGLGARIREFRPDVVVAVGRKALKTAVALKPGVPVMFCMVLYPWKILKDVEAGNFIGLGMYVDSKDQVDMFVKAFEWAKRVGFVRTEGCCNEVQKRLKQELSERGVKVVDMTVTDSRSALKALESLKDRVNAYWLLPDREVLTAPFMQRLMELSFRFSQPVISFSRKGVAAGADMALVFDEHDVARELNRVLDTLRLKGKKAHTRILPMSRWRLVINKTVLDKMGVIIPDEVLIRAAELY